MMRGAVLVCAVLLLAACDSSGERPDNRSTFLPEEALDRTVEGRVLRGAEVVPGAIVRIEPGAGIASGREDGGAAAGYLAATDVAGKFRILDAPRRFDLSIRTDREVAVFRGLSARYLEPALGSGAGLAEGPIRGFTASVAATTDPPPAPGNAVAFFVSGATARAASGGADAGSLVVAFRQFDTVITLHAVEYVASGGLATALRFGRKELRVSSGAVVSDVVPLSAVDKTASANDVTFVAAPPPGFTLSSLDVVMDLGLRTSARAVARVPPGALLHLVIVPGARYFVRATATREGADSDSGLQYFNAFEKTVELTLPPPVTDATFDGSGPLTAPVEKGVVEHVLVPSSPGGVTLRVATGDRATTLPDVFRLGLARPTGRYSWRLQHFPTLTRIEYLSGEDVRVVAPFSTTAPRIIELP